MFKRILMLLAVVCIFLPSVVFAEFAPQFNKSSTDKTDLSSQAPKHGEVYKNNKAMENNVNKNQDVMENKVNMDEQVMENNVKKNKKVMENSLNKNKKVMEMNQ